MLIRNADVWGHGPGALRIEAGRIAAVGDVHALPGEAELDANGGALLPGLHDHHIHLNAYAARVASLWCGPPDVTTTAELRRQLVQAPGEGWIRGIGYHESVAGLPDARTLDGLLTDRPLRIQHRSGRMWLLNTLALDTLLALAEPPPGLEREHGRYTGHLFDDDGWLRRALGGAAPDLQRISRELASFGVTGVTDMSPHNDADAAAHVAQQASEGRLLQHAILAGTLELASVSPRHWRLGPAKLHLHEAALPPFDAVCAFFAAAHEQGRGVAIHCVTEAELAYTLAALDVVGSRPGDRIEHASIADAERVAHIAALGLAVVSQPHFVAERGDQYRVDVEKDLQPHLYRLQSFVRAGVTLAGGSDAPFGGADPWAAMRAAISRRTRSGVAMGPQEALTPERALELFLADGAELTKVRRLAPGDRADLCLLDGPWREARHRLTSEDVRGTWVAGERVFMPIDC